MTDDPRIAVAIRLLKEDGAKKTPEDLAQSIIEGGDSCLEEMGLMLVERKWVLKVRLYHSPDVGMSENVFKEGIAKRLRRAEKFRDKALTAQRIAEEAIEKLQELASSS